MRHVDSNMLMAMAAMGAITVIPLFIVAIMTGGKRPWIVFGAIFSLYAAWLLTIWKFGLPPSGIIFGMMAVAISITLLAARRLARLSKERGD